MSNIYDSNNPFASPLGESSFAPPAPTTGYPTFSRVMFIVSLVLSVLRLLMIPLSLVGYQILQEADNPQVVTVPWEIAMSSCLALFGILGNGLLLARQKLGVTLGWLLVASVLGSIGVGIWQATFVLEQFPEGSAERMGGIGGIVITLMIRFAILGAYVYALMLFSKWINNRSR